jgi:UDP-N-acetylglucosamine diphosphorylase/glucosamine-1-phosphate N-acetyltransferase
MEFHLFELPSLAAELRPFTLTRPVALIRTGMFTSRERWEFLLNRELSISGSNLTALSWPVIQKTGIWIDAAWIPSETYAQMVPKLLPGQALFCDNRLLAAHLFDTMPENPVPADFLSVEYLPDALLLNKPWEIFSLNGKCIRSDFSLFTRNRKSVQIEDPFTRVYNPDQVFVEEGAEVLASVINASEGPVYIGKGVQIQEGSLIRGPVALMDNSVVNMGAKIRPDTTIGPYCKVGGEINNSVFFGFSNKAHDGFLGNSVIGEWCNLGADSNNSNLKNNYAQVKVWSHSLEEMQSTGLQFCGLLMGDHSKAGINSMFNTGTVVDPCCNLFDSGFPPVHVPPFTWGNVHSGFETYRFEKFLEAEERVFSRRGKVFDEEYKSLLRHLFTESLAGKRI